MKKLVVLALVLAVSCVANAGISLSVVDDNGGLIEPGDILTISAVSDGGNLADVTLALTSAAAPTVDVSAATVSAPFNAVTGNFGVINVTGGEGLEAYGMVIMADLVNPNASTVAMVTGTVVSNIKLTFAAKGDYVIAIQNWTDGGSALNTTQTISVVPEPMTLGLLGLGGLFLRRRLA